MFRKDIKSLLEKSANPTETLLEAPPAVDLEFLNKNNIDEQEFRKVFDRLLQNWWISETATPDCEGKRFVLAKLFKDLQNPLKLSIIADNLDVFKRSYKESESKLLFELCCICGSETIINDFFLDTESGKHYLLESENAIAYALSSGKNEFALKLAEKAKGYGRTEPGLISLYSLDMSTLRFSQKIADIFSQKITQEPTESSATSSTNELPPTFTPQHKRAQSPKEQLGEAKAKQLLSMPEFAEFFRTAESNQIKLLFDILKEDRSDFNKRQKNSHPTKG